VPVVQIVHTEVWTYLWPGSFPDGVLIPLLLLLPWRGWLEATALSRFRHGTCHVAAEHD